MASFLNDICALTGREVTTFQEKHDKEILERLCDPSASLKDWEIAANNFLGIKRKIGDHFSDEMDDVPDFERYLNNSFKTLVKGLQIVLNKLQDSGIPGLSLNPSSNGNLLSALRSLVFTANSIKNLQRHLACLAVVKAHYQARKLRSILKYLQEDAQQVTAEQVSDLIRTTDEVDQALLSIRGSLERGSQGIETLLHDSIYETAQRSAILPSRLHMQEVMTMPTIRVNGGGFSDIYKGTLSNGQVIALKVPRCFGKPDEIRKVHAEISKEGVVWHFSSHINVLPLLGISCIKFQNGKPDLLVLVTPWMANGTLKEFLRSNPKTNRAQIIRDVASGVEFLHTERVPPVVHGDLRCDNILVDESGVPKIADFGLSRVKDFQASLTGTSLAGARGSLRWQAPELLFPETLGGTGKHTFASDIYALGMTCLEIVTNEVPYFGFPDAQVITAVLHGNIPKVSDNAVYQRDYGWQWERIKRCWSRNVEDRPSAAKLIYALL